MFEQYGWAELCVSPDPKGRWHAVFKDRPFGEKEAVTVGHGDTYDDAIADLWPDEEVACA